MKMCIPIKDLGVGLDCKSHLCSGDCFFTWRQSLWDLLREIVQLHQGVGITLQGGRKLFPARLGCGLGQTGVTWSI